MINIAVVRYNLSNLIQDEICDAIYVPWSGFEQQPIWSCNAGLYTPELFNAKYDVEATNPDNWRVITGGEPLMQGGIDRFISLLYNAISCPIRLDTDGVFPERLNNVIKSGHIAHIAMRMWAPISEYRKNRLVDSNIIEQSLHYLALAVSSEIIIPYDPNFTNLDGILKDIERYCIESITIMVLGEQDQHAIDRRLDYMYGIDDRYNPVEIAEDLRNKYKDDRINIIY